MFSFPHCTLYYMWHKCRLWCLALKNCGLAGHPNAWFLFNHTVDNSWILLPLEFPNFKTLNLLDSFQAISSSSPWLFLEMTPFSSAECKQNWILALLLQELCLDYDLLQASAFQREDFDLWESLKWKMEGSGRQGFKIYIFVIHNVC